MATVVIVIAAIVIVLAARELTPRAWRRITAWRHRRHQMTECAGCGRPLRETRAVTIGDTWAAHDGGIGGTGVSTDWHRRCLRRARRLDQHADHRP